MSSATRPGDGDVAVAVAGETLLLLPERAAFWPREKTLLIADPHWGKAAAFRAGGIPVPSGTTAETVQRLDALVERVNAGRVVFLGDLLHARAGRSKEMFDSLSQWHRSRPALGLLLVRGNHDRRAGDPPDETGIECVDAPHLRAPFVFAHHPGKDERGYVLAGHVHPGVRLYGAARQTEKLPCFVIGRRSAILPAFGEFTGLGLVEPGEGEVLYAVAGDRVMRAGI